MPTPQKANVIATIRKAFAAMGAASDPLKKTGPGKIYEAWTLVNILENLKTQEGVTVAVHGGSTMRFRAGHGPIDKRFTWLECQSRTQSFEIWTDIEVLSLSHNRRPGAPTSPVDGDMHELDIVAVASGTTGHPRHDQILWGIECKHTTFSKAFHRSMLGMRRELSLFRGNPQRTAFTRYPAADVESDPPSVLTAFSTDRTVTRFQPAGDAWDIIYTHLPMP